MPRRHAKPGVQPVYRTKPLQAHVDDSYKARGKPHDPTVCPACKAVFHDGRWRWMPAPSPAREEPCPACHRIRDDQPAGYVKLEGAFLREHRDEILALVRNLEQKEKAAHPLQRIMKIADEADGVLVTTTDSHLARNVGEALRHAYQGELEIHYNPDDNLARVHWKR
ncbi:MAG: ATPase [Betaproteobacteria bacterium]|nr:MAG: ATPase [Betaproteobacteria bacterium]